MSYISDIMDKANTINPNSTASDLYLFAKAINDAGIQDVPKTFVQGVKARFLNPGTTDPNEIAYLQKILNYTNAWTMHGVWYTGDGGVRNIGNNSKTYPAHTVADLLTPQQMAVFSSPGTIDFYQVFKSSIPYWYKDTVLFRVRVWGAGGSGARTEVNNFNHVVTGGGGGGYAEGLITYASIKSNAAVTVGAGGLAPTNSAGGAPGQASAFGGVLNAGGGAGGALSGGALLNGGAPGVGSGSAALFITQGGYGGGSLFAPGNTSWNFTAGSGGGAAGGPWGAGGNGGSVDLQTHEVHGGAGGGTGGMGAPSSNGDRSGGASAPYQDRWKTVFLQSLGGVPGTSSQRHGGFGTGGAGGTLVKNGNVVLDPIRNGGNGGAFGGGGGLGSAGYSVGGSVSTYSAGHGGIGGGGGAAAVYSGGTAGNGGNGLVIIEWFV